MPSEISAAFALVQLDNLENNLRGRADNFKILADSFSQSPNFETFRTYENVFTGWLAFPMLLTNKLKGKRKQLQIFLEKAGIQTRTIFTGNILKQPVMKNRIYKKHPKCDEVANDVMKNGILLGCHQGMNKKDLDYICKTFERLIK